MPFDANGNHTLPNGTIVQIGDKVLPSQHNPAMLDLSSSLSAVLKRDGRDGMVAPLNMGGFEIRNVAASQTATCAATVAQLVPIGAILPYAGLAAPVGWLFCYGQAVSRATYAALFAAIGTTYGAGDGATTFNVPDYRDVTLVGRGDMGGTARGLLSNFASTVLGALFGTQAHVLTQAQTPAHFHTGVTSTDPGHSHTIPAESAVGADPFIVSGSSGGSFTASTASAGAHAHTFTTSSVGGGLAHPNVQPSAVVNMIIRATY